MNFGKSAGEITRIWTNMSHRDGDAFEKFWAAQNAKCGRPIPGAELQRRYDLVRRAQLGEKVSIEEQLVPHNLWRVVPIEREPGEEG